MDSDYGRIYAVVHDLVLALRAIERTVGSRDGQMAVNKMRPNQVNDLLRFIREADVHAVRTLINTILASQDLTTLSYSALRERASRLHIVKFNKMHKGELIENIVAVEETLSKQLFKMQKPRIGYIEGDGI